MYPKTKKRIMLIFKTLHNIYVSRLFANVENIDLNVPIFQRPKDTHWKTIINLIGIKYAILLSLFPSWFYIWCTVYVYRHFMCNNRRV